MTRFGIEVSYADPCDLADWRVKLRPNTRLLFLETPTNPLRMRRHRGLANIAHKAGARLAVDIGVLTPARQKPRALGADLVIHSATKYLDGQGSAIGGPIVSNKADGEALFGFIRSAGPPLSAFNARVVLSGLGMMALRMRAHSANARSAGFVMRP